MELRLTFQDKVLHLSIRVGKMVLEATIPPLSPHLNLNLLVPYFLTLALLFSFISIPPLQKYAILPVFFFFLTLFVALYFALDYRYLIGSGLLFLLATPFFLIAGQEQVAEELANYTYGFLVFGLLFIAINSLAEKVRKRGYLALYQRSALYLFLVSLVGTSFFFVDGLYGQQIATTLGQFRPRVEAREFFSADLVLLFKSQGENIESVLRESFDVILASQVPSRLQEKEEQTYGAAYNDLGETPKWMEPQEEYVVPIELINVGSALWEAGGANPVHLGYHWSDAKTGKVVIRDSLRASLPQDVGPGQKVVVEVPVLTPREEGTYVLSYDLVKEGQFWFSRKGSDPLEKLVLVSGQERVAPSTKSFVFAQNIDFANNLRNQFQVRVRIPASGLYDLLITERWEDTLASLMFRVDGGSWREISGQELKDRLALIRGVQLDRGDHKIYFKNSVPNYNFDGVGVLGFFLLKSPEKGASSGTQSQAGAKQKVADVSLEKVDLTRYVVHIKGAQGPFFLHLNQPFHSNWTASTGGKTNPYHFQDEEGENVWFMDKSRSYDLAIEYQGLDPLRTLRWVNLAGLAIFLFLIPYDLYRLQKGRKDLSKTSS